MGRTKVRLLKGSLTEYWKVFLEGAEDVGPGPILVGIFTGPIRP